MSTKCSYSLFLFVYCIWCGYVTVKKIEIQHEKDGIISREYTGTDFMDMAVVGVKAG